MYGGNITGLLFALLVCRGGNISDLLAAGSLHEYLMDLHARHGPLASFWFGEQVVVSAASPELFGELSSSFNRPGKERFLKDLFSVI